MPLPLALSLAGLEKDASRPWAAGPREAILWAASLGAPGVQLDAGSLRARDLDRSARRDLAATLRRAELRFAGLDLWIPPEHFADPAHQDRAVAALMGAIELAADLRGLTAGPSANVSLVFPPDTDSLVLRQLHQHAEVRSVFLADHAWPADPRLLAADHASAGGLCPGLDPAALLMAGEKPEPAAARLASRLGSARLSDVAASGRVAPGARGGRLDADAYFISLEVGGYSRPLVLDLRGVPDQERAAARALAPNG